MSDRFWNKLKAEASTWGTLRTPNGYFELNECGKIKPWLGTLISRPLLTVISLLLLHYVWLWRKGNSEPYKNYVNLDYQALLLWSLWITCDIDFPYASEFRIHKWFPSVWFVFKSQLVWLVDNCFSFFSFQFKW